ncbi:MAG: DUF2066 domain-containing protein [Methylotetracoccus sp.]
MRLLFTLLVAALVSARMASAEAVTGLFEEELAVAATDDRTRREDFRRALGAVLARVAPVDALGLAPVAALLGRSQDFVQEFEYLSGAAATGEAAARSRLRVAFDEAHLTQALSAQRIALWGENRPDVVVWLTVQQGAERRFGGDEMGFGEPLQAAAVYRRLPVTIPLFDLTDQTNLPSTDLENADAERIRAATAHYDSDFALIGSITKLASGQIEASWRLVGLGESATWRSASSEPRAVLQAGVDGAYTRLLAMYARRSAATEAVEVQVKDLNSMSDATRCGDYLRELPQVRAADWLRAETDGTVWRVRYAGTPAALRRMLDNSRLLRADPAAAGSDQSFVFHWTS